MGTLRGMTDSEAPRPFFTRKRLIAGAVGLLLLLTVAALRLGVFGGHPMEPVKVTFLKFEQSRDGKAAVAMVKLENTSKETITFCSVDKLETLYGQFIPRDGTNSFYLPLSDGMAMRTDGTNLAPHSVSTNRILLPMDGSVGQFAVFGYVLPRNRTGLLGRARLLWWRIRPPELSEVWATCGQEIQCPKRLPDGTVEPPRLLPTAERQP